jgi:hypothetical protein
VESLVRSERPDVPAHQIVKELESLKLIKPAAHGLFLPANISARITSPHPILLEHLALSVARLLSTAYSNTKTRGSGAALIERYAHVPDLRGDKVRAFRDFTYQQGEALLATADDWLESNRSRKRGKAGRRSFPAGIHVFAFVGKSRSS